MAALLVDAHMVMACVALLAGIGALVFPNGTKRHKRLGVVYLVSWAFVGVTGLFFGRKGARVSGFEICAGLGMLSTAIAWGCVLLRKRIGASWLHAHYLFMLMSMAALLGPTSNQLVWNLGFDPPRWTFWALIVAPWFVVLPYKKRLDLRFMPKRRAA